MIIRQSAGQKKTRIDARGGYIHSQSIVHRHLRTTKVECNRYWCNVTKGIQVGFLVDADTFDHLDQHFCIPGSRSVVRVPIVMNNTNSAPIMP